MQRVICRLRLIRLVILIDLVPERGSVTRGNSRTERAAELELNGGFFHVAAGRRPALRRLLGTPARYAFIVGALLLFPAHFCHAELSVVSTWPVNDAKEICPDTLLRIECREIPELGTNGRVLVYRVTDGKLADALDLGAPGFDNNFAGKLLCYEAIHVEGKTVSIHLHSHSLEWQTGYRVVVEPGVLRDKKGNVFKGLGQVSPWNFTTKNSPQKGTNLVIAEDSSGDYCTLQAAVDSVSDDNQSPVRMGIRNGNYDGMVYLTPGKDFIHWVGEDRKHTIISGFNNDRFNSGRNGRALVSVDANDFTVENLTIRNTTPYRGSQAEALRVKGDKCVVKNCDFYSFQDTLLLSGRVYVTNCYIEGDVDFIWGQGITMFDQCELKALHNGYYLQSRNPCDHFGYVFLDCKLTAAPDAQKCLLARIEAGRFPCSAAVFINCQMGPHIPAVGWEAKGTNTSGLKFWEFQSHDADGKPVDVSKRLPASKQISAAQAAALSDPAKVFAEHDVWNPRL